MPASFFFSSVKAVADNVSGEYLTEDAVPNPKTAYGKSKLEAEKYILNHISSPDFGLPTSVFRLPTSDFGQKSIYPSSFHDSWPRQ